MSTPLLVSTVYGTQLKKPDPVIFGGKEGVATGIVEMEDKLITILDFEAIIAEICPESSIQYEMKDSEMRATAPVATATSSLRRTHVSSQR